MSLLSAWWNSCSRDIVDSPLPSCGNLWVSSPANVYSCFAGVDGVSFVVVDAGELWWFRGASTSRASSSNLEKHRTRVLFYAVSSSLSAVLSLQNWWLENSSLASSSRQWHHSRSSSSSCPSITTQRGKHILFSLHVHVPPKETSSICIHHNAAKSHNFHVWPNNFADIATTSSSSLRRRSFDTLLNHEIAVYRSSFALPFFPLLVLVLVARRRK